MERCFGVKYLATVSFSAEPSSSSTTVWTDPFPKVWHPTTTARPWSWSAPATISLALALPRLTRSTTG